LGNDDVGSQPLAEAERDEDAGGIGGELDAGAGLFQPFGRFVDGNAEVVLGERQRRREPADTGAGDDDGARGGHGSCLRR
jgi:hypothetical protein